jgi:rod shape-determining protein MreC
MHNLIEFLKNHFHWIVFLLLESAGAILFFQFNDYQASVWFTSANEFTATLDKVYSDLASYVSLGKVNRDLTARNIMLQRQVTQLREILESEGEDSLALDEKQRRALDGFRLIPATVTSNSITKVNNFIVIDRGEADGIRSEMGVVSGGGIVGIVFLTGPHYSLVMPVLNSKSRISCRIRGHRFFGYLGWDGGNPLVATLSDVPRYARFKVGDYVETSGYSSVFPPGLFVGRIINIGNSSDGLSFRVKVHLSTDFANLRDVCVIANSAKPEIDSLQVRAQEMEQPEQ